MSRSKTVLLFLLIAFFTLSSIIPAYAAQIRKKKIEFKQIEIYFDGGYYFTGLSQGDDAIKRGSTNMEELISFIADTMSSGTNTVWGSDQELGGSRSIGGGLNYNINPMIGVGFKFLISIHKSASRYHLSVQGYETYDNYFEEELLVNAREDYCTYTNYNFAPVMVNAYYKIKPMPTMKNLTATMGLGLGVYTTSIEVRHSYLNTRELVGVGSYVDLPPNFYEYRNTYVAKPLGGYIFGGLDLKGSDVISLSLDVEYHFVPEITLKQENWRSDQDLMYWPSYLEYIQEFYDQVFDGYKPDKLSISGLRLAASINFAF